MIKLNKTFFPPIEEYNSQVQRIWNNQWVTNRGELVLELEEKIKDYLSISNIIVTSNGTVPLLIALNLLGNHGEIITTPFSYIATTASIVWQNCTPVFVDIHQDFLTIDETKIEQAITSKTTAILATHVFGNPCHTDAIEAIARKHHLKVIYDAAHCFAASYKGNSLFSFGDISSCSFHASKLFHTGEGGAMFANDPELRHQLFYSHNFGHNGQLAFYGLGINGKMSELQAAMGLAVLPYMDQIIEERKKIVEFYNENLDFSKLRTLKLRDNTSWNYCYYPLIFQSEADLLNAEGLLNQNDIFPRRYFYPAINKVDYVAPNIMPVSESISSRLICLPLYVGLSIEDQKKIVFLINKANLR